MKARRLKQSELESVDVNFKNTEWPKKTEPTSLCEKTIFILSSPIFFRL